MSLNIADETIGLFVFGADSFIEVISGIVIYSTQILSWKSGKAEHLIQEYIQNLIPDEA